MGGYLERETFRDWTRNEIKGGDDLIDQAIAAAEELIDSEAGRSLVLVDESVAPTAQQFRPLHNVPFLDIPDAAEVTSVVENGNPLVVDEDYVLEPFGNLDPATQAWRPYHQVTKAHGCWYTNGHLPTVTVTARWGWAEIPAVVVEACKVLAQDWLEHRNVRLGVVGSTNDGFSIGVRSSPLVARAVEVVAGPRTVGVWGA